MLFFQIHDFFCLFGINPSIPLIAADNPSVGTIFATNGLTISLMVLEYIIKILNFHLTYYFFIWDLLNFILADMLFLIAFLNLVICPAVKNNS